MEGIRELLQLDNVADGFRYERRFELFFDSRVIGFVKFSDLAGDFDYERESPFEKEDNTSHLSEDISPW